METKFKKIDTSVIIYQQITKYTKKITPGIPFLKYVFLSTAL